MNSKTVEKEFLVASDDIDVTQIMDKIKEKIQAKMDSGVLKQREIDEMEAMELLPLPDFLDIPNVYQPHLYPENQNKQVLEDFNPVHFNEEIEEGFSKKILGKIRKIIFPIIRFMSRPIYNELKNMTVELHNANKQSIHNLPEKLEAVNTIVIQSKEYIRLLHNTINNMIVESTKLKIGDELHKTKIKVLEDKLEFLENRERALEKKVYKWEKYINF